jgi:Flp pilus assembly protein TadD
MTLGEQFLRINDPAKARVLLEQAVQENPQLGPARELLARLLVDSGEVDPVFALLEPVYQNAPERFEVLAVLGEAYFHQKQYGKTTELLERAITLRRPELRLLNILALAHHQLGNDARAVEILERSLSLNPDQPPLKELLEKLKPEAKSFGPKDEELDAAIGELERLTR